MNPPFSFFPNARGLGVVCWAFSSADEMRTFLSMLSSRICLCLVSLKNMNADLKRRGAPGAFLNFDLLVAFFFGGILVIVLLLATAKKGEKQQKRKVIFFMEDTSGISGWSLLLLVVTRL